MSVHLLDEHFIRHAIPEVTIISNKFPEDMQFAVDTRLLQKGDIFVAVPGAKIDGHLFIEEALAKGAAGLIISQDKVDLLKKINAKELAKKLIIAVPNTVIALIQIASAWRSQFNYPVIAVTGSVGKTSTKEIIANILRVNGNKFIVSHGNQNTRIGIALNILKMRADHDMAIFEVGINKRNEMAELSKLLRPTTALITAIGHCHMEGLGSLADIALEKRDVFKFFSEQNIGIIYGDQPILSAVSYPHPVVKFGAKTTNQIQARKIRLTSTQVNFVMKIYRQKYNVTLSKPHTGIVFNALAATAVAHFLGVSNEVIIKGIETPLAIPGRFETLSLKKSKGILINDCYNANPESMKTALLAFQHIETSAQKIAVLGDMLELGVNSPFWHRQVGRFLRKVPSLRRVILVGDLVKWTKKTAPVGIEVEIVPNWQAAVDLLQLKLDNEALVLVKGSNGVGLRNLVESFT